MMSERMLDLIAEHMSSSIKEDVRASLEHGRDSPGTDIPTTCSLMCVFRERQPYASRTLCQIVAPERM
jgi:hypothetical protein